MMLETGYQDRSVVPVGDRELIFDGTVFQSTRFHYESEGDCVLFQGRGDPKSQWKTFGILERGRKWLAASGVYVAQSH